MLYIFNLFKHYTLNKIKNILYSYIVNCLSKRLLVLYIKYPTVHYYMTNLYKYIYAISYLTMNLLHCILSSVKKRHPYIHKVIIFAYREYIKVISGNLEIKHIIFFIILGLYLQNEFYFYWLSILGIVKFLKDNVIKNQMFVDYPLIHNTVISLLTALYMISLYSCMDISYESLILPLLKKMLNYFNNIKYTVLNMTGYSSGSPGDIGGSPTNSPSPSPSPNPNSSPNIAVKSDNKKERDNLDSIDKDDALIKVEFTKLRVALDNYNKLEGTYQHEIKYSLNDIIRDYLKYLPKEDSTECFRILSKDINKGYPLYNGTETWKYKKRIITEYKQQINGVLGLLDKNSKHIQESLGGRHTDRAEFFRRDLTRTKELYSGLHKLKNNYANNQLKEVIVLDKLLKKHNKSIRDYVK